MSFHVFFAFSTGLKQPIIVPKGTLASIHAHIAEVESTLGLARTQYKDNPAHWDRFKCDFSTINQDVLCRTVEEHNDWARRLYHRLAVWSMKPPEDGEEITPEQASAFWHGLEILDVPVDRWNKDYYRSRMEHIYEVMRGRESEGVTFDTKPLTPKQAAQVVILLAPWLDKDDIRLDVPNGHDTLASSYNGEYDWCEKCGAVGQGDWMSCRRRKCPLREEFRDEE